MFFPTFTEGLAGDDGTCLADALDEDGTQLLGDSRDGVSCDKVTAEMSDDHSHGITSEREDRVTDEDRDADAQILGDESSGLHEEVADPETDLLINDDQITEVHHRFKNTGEECRKRSTCDAHLRSAEVTEDQDVVSGEVYDERADRDVKRESGLADASQNDRDDQGKPQEEEGQRGPAEICSTEINEFFFTGVGSHDELRHEDRADGKYRREKEHQAEHQANGLFEGNVCFFDVIICFFHAVITGDQNGCSHAKAHAEDLEDQDIGIGQ